MKARVHKGDGGTYLWVINPTRKSRSAVISMSRSLGQFQSATDLWQGQKVLLKGSDIEITVADRDAAVIRLQ